jgi:hypothetical protein
VKNKLLLAGILVLLVSGCKNPFWPEKKSDVKNNAKPGVEIKDGLSYTVEVNIIDKGDGDSVAALPLSGKAGTSITLNYTVANTAFYNFLDFGGVTEPIASVTKAGSGTRTYTINPADAPDGGKIVIIATFVHTDLTPDPVTFTDTTPHIVKTYGDEAFTNAIADTYLGSGAISYSGEDETVATVDNNGTVTIGKPGTTVITVHKADDAKYAGAARSYALTVMPKPVTITGLGAQDKVYDGTKTATITGTAVIEGLLPGDTVTVNHGTAAFESAAAGNKKTVTFSGFSLAGADAGNYTLSAQPESVTAAIFEQSDLIAFTDPESDIVKTYGDAAFTNAITDDHDGSGAITYSSGDETVATVDNDGLVTMHKVGTTIITAHKAADAGYAAASRSYTLTVEPKAVTISVSVGDKVYDGTTTVTITGTPQIDGLVGVDEVSVIEGTAGFGDKNAGSDKPVGFTGWSLVGADAGNYSLSVQPASVTANITAKPVTITGLGAANKVYDRTTTVTISGTAVINGLISGDTVTINYGTAAFANAAVGNGKTVTFSGFSLDGTDAGNYSLSAQLVTTANITAKPVTITGLTAANKVYDGTTTATRTGTAAINGLISGDAVSVNYGTAAFASAIVGNGKTVTFSGFSLGGADAGNYSLSAQPASVTANITAKALTVTVGNPSRTLIPFDSADTQYGTTATVSITVNGIVGSDTVSVNLVTNSYGITASNANFTTSTGAVTWTLTYNGTTSVNQTTALNIGLTVGNSNYTLSDSPTVRPTVIDGQANTRAIPVTLANITAFNTYANTTNGNGRARHYKLMENITLTGTNNWTAIGTDTASFTGSFDGQLNTITGLNINTTGNYQGFFGCISRTTTTTPSIRNLGLVGVSIIGSGSIVGGVVGQNYAGTVENCYTTGTVNGNFTVGGVVGINYGTVQNCYATGDVSGEVCVGGVVGSVVSNCTVRNCYATGDVIGTISIVGGVVGGGGNSTIQNSVALNRSVRLNTSDYIYRVFAGTNTDELINNYARNPMTVQYNWNGTTGTNKTINAGLNTVDGANMTTTEAVTATWWTAAGRWSTANGGSAWDFTNIWNPPSGTRLPTLRNMPAGTQNPVVQ